MSIGWLGGKYVRLVTHVEARMGITSRQKNGAVVPAFARFLTAACLVATLLAQKTAAQGGSVGDVDASFSASSLSASDPDAMFVGTSTTADTSVDAGNPTTVASVIPGTLSPPAATTTLIDATLNDVTNHSDDVTNVSSDVIDHVTHSNPSMDDARVSTDMINSMQSSVDFTTTFVNAGQTRLTAVDTTQDVMSEAQSVSQFIVPGSEDGVLFTNQIMQTSDTALQSSSQNPSPSFHSTILDSTGTVPLSDITEIAESQKNTLASISPTLHATVVAEVSELVLGVSGTFLSSAVSLGTSENLPDLPHSTTSLHESSSVTDAPQHSSVFSSDEFTSSAVLQTPIPNSESPTLITPTPVSRYDGESSSMTEAQSHMSVTPVSPSVSLQTISSGSYDVSRSLVLPLGSADFYSFASQSVGSGFSGDNISVTSADSSIKSSMSNSVSETLSGDGSLAASPNTAIESSRTSNEPESAQDITTKLSDVQFSHMSVSATSSLSSVSELTTLSLTEHLSSNITKTQGLEGDITSNPAISSTVNPSAQVTSNPLDSLEPKSIHDTSMTISSREVSSPPAGSLPTSSTDDLLPDVSSTVTRPGVPVSDSGAVSSFVSPSVTQSLHETSVSSGGFTTTSVLPFSSFQTSDTIRTSETATQTKLPPMVSLEETSSSSIQASRELGNSTLVKPDVAVTSVSTHAILASDMKLSSSEISKPVSLEGESKLASSLNPSMPVPDTVSRSAFSSDALLSAFSSLTSSMPFTSVLHATSGVETTGLPPVTLTDLSVDFTSQISTSVSENVESHIASSVRVNFTSLSDSAQVSKMSVSEITNVSPTTVFEFSSVTLTTNTIESKMSEIVNVPEMTDLSPSSFALFSSLPPISHLSTGSEFTQTPTLPDQSAVFNGSSTGAPPQTDIFTSSIFTFPNATVLTSGATAASQVSTSFASEFVSVSSFSIGNITNVTGIPPVVTDMSISNSVSTSGVTIVSSKTVSDLSASVGASSFPAIPPGTDHFITSTVMHDMSTSTVTTVGSQSHLSTSFSTTAVSGITAAPYLSTALTMGNVSDLSISSVTDVMMSSTTNFSVSSSLMGVSTVSDTMSMSYVVGSSMSPATNHSIETDFSMSSVPNSSTRSVTEMSMTLSVSVVSGFTSTLSVTDLTVNITGATPSVVVPTVMSSSVPVVIPGTPVYTDSSMHVTIAPSFSSVTYDINMTITPPFTTGSYPSVTAPPFTSVTVNMTDFNVTSGVVEHTSMSQAGGLNMSSEFTIDTASTTALSPSSTLSRSETYMTQFTTYVSNSVASSASEILSEVLFPSLHSSTVLLSQVSPVVTSVLERNTSVVSTVAMSQSSVVISSIASGTAVTFSQSNFSFTVPSTDVFNKTMSVDTPLQSSSQILSSVAISGLHSATEELVTSRLQEESSDYMSVPSAVLTSQLLSVSSLVSVPPVSEMSMSPSLDHSVSTFHFASTQSMLSTITSPASSEAIFPPGVSATKTLIPSANSTVFPSGSMPPLPSLPASVYSTYPSDGFATQTLMPSNMSTVSSFINVTFDSPSITPSSSTIANISLEIMTSFVSTLHSSYQTTQPQSLVSMQSSPVSDISQLTTGLSFTTVVPAFTQSASVFSTFVSPSDAPPTVIVPHTPDVSTSSAPFTVILPSQTVMLSTSEVHSTSLLPNQSATPNVSTSKTPPTVVVSTQSTISQLFTSTETPSTMTVPSHSSKPYVSTSEASPLTLETSMPLHSTELLPTYSTVPVTSPSLSKSLTSSLSMTTNVFLTSSLSLVATSGVFSITTDFSSLFATVSSTGRPAFSSVFSSTIDSNISHIVTATLPPSFASEVVPSSSVPSLTTSLPSSYFVNVTSMATLASSTSIVVPSVSVTLVPSVNVTTQDTSLTHSVTTSSSLTSSHFLPLETSVIQSSPFSTEHVTPVTATTSFSSLVISSSSQASRVPTVIVPSVTETPTVSSTVSHETVTSLVTTPSVVPSVTVATQTSSISVTTPSTSLAGPHTTVLPSVLHSNTLSSVVSVHTISPTSTTQAASAVPSTTFSLGGSSFLLPSTSESITSSAIPHTTSPGGTPEFTSSLTEIASSLAELTSSLVILPTTSSTSEITSSSAAPTTPPQDTTTTAAPTTTPSPGTTPQVTTPTTQDPNLVVVTVIRLRTDDDVNSQTFRDSMEEGLARAYALALARQQSGGGNNRRKRRFAAFLYKLLEQQLMMRRRRAVSGNVEVKITDAQKQASNPSNAELHYTVAESGQTVPATQASSTLNTLQDQEMALELQRVVVTVARPAAQEVTPVQPEEDKKLWIIGAVLGPLVLIVIVWIVVCVAVRHSQRNKDKAAQERASEPHLLTVKHGPDVEETAVADDQEYSQPTPGQSNGLFKSSPRKMTYEVNPDPDVESPTSTMKKGKKSPKKKKGSPVANGSVDSDTLQKTGEEDPTPTKKKTSKKPSFRDTGPEEMEMSPLDPGFYNSQTMQNSTVRSQLHSQPTFEEEEEFIENVEEERKRNKQRQRLRKKQQSQKEPEPPVDSTQAAYERAQKEIDRVLGPRDTNSVPDVIVGNAEKKRSKKKSKKGQVNEGFTGDHEAAKHAGSAAPEAQETLDEVRSRVHALLDDAFSLISNSYTSIGNKVAPASPGKTERPHSAEAEHRAPPTQGMPEVEEVRGPKPGEKLHTPVYVDRTYGDYDASGLITWSPYRASDESARIVLPLAEEPSAKAPVQEKVHTTTFMETAASAQDRYYATQPGQPIVIRTQQLPHMSEREGRGYHIDRHGEENGYHGDDSRHSDGHGGRIMGNGAPSTLSVSRGYGTSADAGTSYIPYPGLETYDSVPIDTTTTTAHFVATPITSHEPDFETLLHRSFAANGDAVAHSDTAESLPENHRPPMKSVGSRDERDIITESLKPGSSPKELVDSIRQELQSMSGKLASATETGEGDVQVRMTGPIKPRKKPRKSSYIDV